MSKSEKYINGIQEYKIDIAVLLIFFCRDDKFSKVFEQVKEARPSKLYLYQDGPRNEKDKDGIQRCRNIASEVNWECEIHIWYQEENVGCDPSEYLAQRWMFEQEEMGIVLEDDDVPSQSFFPYCKELLEKYKDDERINMICGMNNTGVSEYLEDSYLFTTKGSCWGWASWKRVVEQWDENYSWLDSKRDLLNLKCQRITKHEYKAYIDIAEKHRTSGKAYYETVGGMDVFLHNRLNIVPKYNMITNIGVGEETTHGTSDLRLLPKEVARLFHMKRYEIEFPLKHPKYMMPDYLFEKKMHLTSPAKAWRLRVEVLIRRIWFGIRG